MMDYTKERKPAPSENTEVGSREGGFHSCVENSSERPPQQHELKPSNS